MSSVDARQPASRAYWRSLEELADTPRFRAFVAKEFPFLPDELWTGPTRRRFLQLMGASLSLAGLAGCRWPTENILPYAKRPANRTPGGAVQYATAWELAGMVQGLLVTSFDGRPIKVEGNPDHPVNGGATDAFAQAAVLEIYDPDRAKVPTLRTGREQSTARAARSWDECRTFLRAHFAEVRERRGAGCVVLSEATTSPTVAALRQRLVGTCPRLEWYEYEPLSRDHEREGTRLAFGRPLRPHLTLDRADVILSLDDDFLMWHPEAVRLTREFASRRRPDARNAFAMNRLYVVESRLSVTGARADERFGVRPSQIAAVLAHVLAAVKRERGLPTAPTLPESPLPAQTLARIVADLMAHAGKCVVLVGPQHPPAVHAQAHALNVLLGNVGQTLRYLAEPDRDRSTHTAALIALRDRLAARDVETLIILGGNPVYDAPADAPLADFGSIRTTMHLSLYENETARQCTWHVPRAHGLETWGDVRAWDGTYSIVQPLIAPLYDGLTPIELLALLAGDTLPRGYDLVRQTFAVECVPAGTDVEAAWEGALRAGVAVGTAWPAVQLPALQPLQQPLAEPAISGLEAVFAPDYHVFDGRFANNAWLQELPDPLTKLTWDNAAFIAPADAARLGVQTGDVVQLATQWRSLEIAAFVLPWQPVGVVTLPLGYGRTAAGAVGNATGFNAYELRTTTDFYAIRDVQVRRTGRRHELATTQDHHYMQTAVGAAETQTRIPQLIRESNLTHYRAEPDFAAHVVHLPQVADYPNKGQLFDEVRYTAPNQWGMAIDLSACTGCGACVLACQSENNIPVVGKEEVAHGREMQWIRVDRYFRGTPEDVAGVAFQPVTCHHCENAPCEQVCPVGATNHDEEGLNVMVYNRCIGTRYCSNNCPYKVRRFNWFWNHHGPAHPRHAQPLDDIEKMQYNPNVTLRSRGVMEKCTFCVQRIAAARISHRLLDQPLPDGAVVPACAQACPAQAIVFGDLADPQSRVSQLAKHSRAYQMLQEINTRPRLRYLARVVNPSPNGTGETPVPPRVTVPPHVPAPSGEQ
jgi:molybdopterin-containing oxidoreductase family iron-sulfur binding subunit